MEEYLIALIGVVIGMILAVIGLMVWKTGYQSGYHSAYGQKSGDAKNNKKTQVNLALLRIKELHEAKTAPLDIAKVIVVEYPDVAFQALREAQKYAKEMGVMEQL